ncbi:hypothetical protein [Clostridium perfringens]|uniref:hypothetical protein n=1 Tax=Clostridium perfringens TaxID=1502 RepID=UPI00096A7DB7|nr:hypothetical protein [Clostridium perfringens]
MVKIIFEDCNPCPLDTSVRCKNSKFEYDKNSFRLILGCRCKYSCDMFNFYKVDDEVYVIRK